MRDTSARTEGLTQAVRAIRRGDLVVLPTDTVYGIGADARRPDAVRALLAAKGRGRDMPPPVLVAHADDVGSLARPVSAQARLLMEAFWPGGLTVVLPVDPDLGWDLGDKAGTIAVRQPDHPVALELLGLTGPLAVSSANVTGRAPAVTAADAEAQLGGSVAVYLDDGEAPGGVASTVVDATRAPFRILRQGAISAGRIAAVLDGNLDAEPGADLGGQG
jgi:tRNA threonylcarbamoyl adenosine modification protein (Sua5/YciO/YrdC/YwlC family)